MRERERKREIDFETTDFKGGWQFCRSDRLRNQQDKAVKPCTQTSNVRKIDFRDFSQLFV